MHSLIFSSALLNGNVSECWAVLSAVINADNCFHFHTVCLRCGAGLDNLADPSGPIADAQALAAEVFGADQTWFLVNGTSVGLQVPSECMQAPHGGSMINVLPHHPPDVTHCLIASEQMRALHCHAHQPCMQAAVMATCNPEDTILVARNCHISVFAAMTLTGDPPPDKQDAMALVW